MSLLVKQGNNKVSFYVNWTIWLKTQSFATPTVDLTGHASGAVASALRDGLEPCAINEFVINGK